VTGAAIAGAPSHIALMTKSAAGILVMDIPPIRNFRPQSTRLSAIRCTDMTISGQDDRSLNRNGAGCNA
jgi:hypothetical protein